MKPFEILTRCPDTQARTGRLRTAHGAVETPVFAPVGTQGSVKTLLSQDLEKLKIQLILANTYHLYLRPVPKYILTALLLLWLASDTILAFPHFMPYYNELAPLAAAIAGASSTERTLPLTGRAGGAAHGSEIAVDSNYDWGQDLIRLADFVRVNNIQKIAVDYFGGGSPRYYLGDRFEPWQSSRGPAHGYFAISITSREGAFGTTAPGFTRKSEDSYEWLRPYTSVANIGHSILVYNLP